MATTKGRGWTLLIIPGSDSGTRQFRLPRAAVILFIGGLILLILYAVIETVLFWAVARRAADADRLRHRVRELESSSEELARLGTELNELRAIEQKVRRVLQTGNTGSSDDLLSGSERTGGGDPMVGDRRIAPSTISAGAGITAMDIPTLSPVSGYITRGFYSVDELHRTSHYGLDFAGKEGTPVLASASGTVVSAGWTHPYGNSVVLTHSSGFVTSYGHNQLVLVRPGDRVRQGEPIALLGNSGISSAPHLHFEVWQDGTPIDPSSLIRNLP